MDQSRSIGANVYSSGWQLLIDDMLDEIAAVIADSGATLVVLQMKEKLGLLRFYYRLQGTTAAQEEAIYAIVRAAVDRSAGVCLHCGGAGRLRRLGGLLVVVCDEHEAAKLRHWDEIAYV